MSGIENTFKIFGVTIHYYGVIMALAIFLAICVCYFLFPKHGLSRDLIFDIGIWAIPLGIIGARVFYVMFSGYHYTFVEALEIWNGGLSIFGAISFGALGVFIACKVKKVSFLKVADCVLPGIIIAQALGRWGNFFNQEAYGPLITNAKWQWFPFGVEIDTFLGTEWHCATFFYESVWNVIGFAVLLILFFKVLNENKTGIVASVYFMWYGFGRFIIEMLRQDPLIIFGSIKFSMWFAFCVFLLGVTLLICILTKNKKRGKENVWDC